MGTVIHLSRGGESKRRTAPSSRGDNRIALVLGGGGITGAAYHLGVLNALDALSEESSVNDFDLYVGTSAGAVIGAALANAITPEDLIRANLGHESATLKRIGADEIMRLDRRGILRSLVRWPLSVVGALRTYAGHPFTTRLIDTVGALAEGLPRAFYTTDGTERYLRELFESPGRSNRFDCTRRKLLITATDIDTAERVVFGDRDNSDVAISEAAAASTAIPLLYAPRQIGDRQYLDGGISSTTNIEVAIAHGAKLIICVNPLVPYVHDVGELLPTATGLPARHLAQKGFPHLAAQTFRIMVHSQLAKELEVVGNAHPDVDIILIEPRRDDEHLFVFNLMDYGSRERVARHAFETVAIDLVTRLADYRRVLGRHGIKLSKARLTAQLQGILDGGEPRFFKREEGDATASRSPEKTASSTRRRA